MDYPGPAIFVACLLHERSSLGPISIARYDGEMAKRDDRDRLPPPPPPPPPPAWLPAGCVAHLMRREVITHELQDDARLMRDRGGLIHSLLESEWSLFISRRN